jgi:D-alanyl-D-alanine endopeptidase (penicillin-binding protein 7)
VKHLVPAFFTAFALLTGTIATAEEPLHVAALESGSQPAETASRNPWDALDPDKLKLRSAAALIMDPEGNIVYAKHEDEPRPIASITKLITAMVILDSELALHERITITGADRDHLKQTGSRLRFGSTLSREQLLRLMLMASENRAALALARTYPGGRTAFVAAMNEKAGALGMHESRFADPAGLNPRNVASARDVATMVRAALDYPLIREATTTRTASVRPFAGMGKLRFGNTNRLLRNQAWDIQLSKTGYINEAGRCLTMQAAIADQPLVIVLLDSFGKLTPFGDSNRIRKWIEQGIDG